MKMRKYVTTALSLTGLILLIAIGCDKEEEVQTVVDQAPNALVFEDPSLIDQVSPHFYDNHIYRIEVLAENREKQRVVRAISESGFDRTCLMMGEVQKFYFNHTELIMYAVPTGDAGKMLILYERSGLFQAILAEYNPLSGNRSRYALKTLDDALYFSFQLDDDNWTGDFQVNDNQIMNDYNTQIYALNFEEGREKSASSEEAACCRKEETYRDCIMCTLDACEESALCRLTALAAGPALAAAIAASCIGAGPGARC
jgi:hypothetical protein